MANRSEDAGADQPTLMTGRSLARIDLEDLIEILAFIREQGEEDRLLRLSRQRKLLVAIPPKTVNHIKRLVAGHAEMRRHPLGRKILHPSAPNADPGGFATAAAAPDPFNSCCGFRPRG